VQLLKLCKKKMKNLTAKQIAQVKTIKTWSSTKFHGNTKKAGSLLVADFKAIVAKKVSREVAKIDTSKKSNVQKVRELIKWSLETKGTGYFKVLIEGNTGIYYASAAYGHSDYNKSRVFEKNADTLKLMELFNAIVSK
jgi:hypothetical protein